MTGSEAIAYIDSFYTNQTTPGLSRIRELMERLGNPHRGLPCLHVAGTNGKGSACAMLAGILQQAGYKTGLFTSPHIVRFHERMQVNGVCIPPDELGAVTALVKPAADAMTEPPNEFEVITAVALTYFARQGCDVVVLEVGLGGEFDATNVIDTPVCALIMNIGLDHTALLGSTVEKIARAKAGIIKPGGDVVIYRGAPGVEAVFEARCAEVGARLHRADFAALEPLSASIEGQSFRSAAWGKLTLPLAGEHQRRNAAVVLAAVRVLREMNWHITKEDIRRGLAGVRWPVRFEIAARDPELIIDGGHNPQCLRAVTDGLRALLPGRRVVFLTGVLADKDVDEMAALLRAAGSEYITVTPDSPRAMAGEELARRLRALGAQAEACKTVKEGIVRARELAATDGVVCCVGSLYLAGEVKKVLAAEKTE